MRRSVKEKVLLLNLEGCHCEKALADAAISPLSYCIYKIIFTRERLPRYARNDKL